MIETTDRQSVRVLRLAHGKANVLDLELCRELTARMHEAERDACEAMVLTGAGNSFCAGVDLRRLLNDGPDYARVFLPALNELFQAVFFFPKPVVAAVNGHAIAGGCILTCAADRRLMASGSGKIGVTELLVGVPFPSIALEIMRHAAAPHRLQRLVYGGGTFSAAEAVDLGLVDEMVGPEELMDRALAAAEQLRSIPRSTFELTKRQLRWPVRERLREQVELFERSVADTWAHQETHDAIRRYAERTLSKSRS
jgi:enoyl-CoA hydratase